MSLWGFNSSRKNLVNVITVLLIVLLLSQVRMASAANEDLTTFTKTDTEGNYDSVTADRVTWSTMDWLDNSHLTKDYGANYFDDFVIWFDVDLSDVEAGLIASRASPRFLCLNDVSTPYGSNKRLEIFLFENGATDDQYKLYIRQHSGVGWVDDYVSAPITNLNAIYCEVNRTGSSLFFDVYTTTALRLAQGAGNVWTVTDNSCYEGEFQYCHVATSWSDGTPIGESHTSGFLENLDFDPPLDNVPPECNYVFLNSTLNGTVGLFQFNLTDDVELDYATFGTNNTGTWVNDTATALSGTAYLFNVTKTINTTSGIVVELRVWFNDTTNNNGSTVLHGFLTNTEPIIVVGLTPAQLFIGLVLLGGVCVIPFLLVRRRSSR